jgi:transposase-like protein
MESNSPKTLLEAVEYFKSPANCREYLIPRRWPDGKVTCPTCGTDRVTFSEKHNRWQCAVHHPKRQFTLKTGTIMEDSPIGLDKWLPAIWLICSNRNGISSWELHRALGVTQKTAWFMLGRIRLAMQDENKGGKLGGPMGEPVEVDETFIGGKARNMHKKRYEKTHRGTSNKAIVMGMLERNGKVRAKVIANTSNPQMRPAALEHIEFGSRVHSDMKGDHWQMPQHYIHEMVNHDAEEYVRGNVHCNGVENFWALLKRTIEGTYVSVEPFHLFRYVDEQAFRFNTRLPTNDGDRFSHLVRKIVGKRLTYAELIGHEVQRPAEAF